MDLDLLIHLEAIPDEHQFVWWAESPDLEGFTASAPHLPELLEKCRAVVTELAAADAVIRPKLVQDEESAAPQVTTQRGSEPESRGIPSAQTHRVLLALTA